jgi:hypothetical protein
MHKTSPARSCTAPKSPIELHVGPDENDAEEHESQLLRIKEPKAEKKLTTGPPGEDHAEGRGNPTAGTYQCCNTIQTSRIVRNVICAETNKAGHFILFCPVALGPPAPARVDPCPGSANIL